MKKACRSCGEPIIWAETEKGKRMPVNPEPADNGNLRLVERDGDVPLAVYDTAKTEALFGDDRRYLSHFPTCKHATGWRRG